MKDIKYKHIYESDNVEWAELTSEEVLLPYDKIPCDKRVVLYGAGKIGTKVYDLAMKDNKWNIVLWVDKNSEQLSEQISKPEDVNKVDFDYVYIAISKKVYQNEAIVKLRELGVDDSSIIIYEPLTRLSQLISVFRENYKDTIDIKYWGDDHTPIILDRPVSVTSMICNQSFFDAPFVHYWAPKVHRNFVDLMRASGQLSEKCLKDCVVYHRKLWEFVYIAQALYENGMLTEGKKGVAFGVGEECLPDLFASMGCRILATDLSIKESVAKGWAEYAQNIGGDYWKLNKYGFCSREDFQNRVQYSDVNMNQIPDEINDYDFCWSACALEHIGGIKAGLDFIKNSLKTLKSGGLAIHTTEYNLFSNERTYESEGLSLFRRRDIEQLITELEKEGHMVFPMDWYVGNGVVDGFIDVPPYSKKDMHLRLLINQFPCTSIGIIIKKK